MTSDILDKIRTRDKISQLIKAGSLDVSYSNFAALRNSIQREIKKAKSNYFRCKLDENMGEPKKLWKYLKDLVYSTKPNSKAKIVLNVDGVIQSETLAAYNCMLITFSLLWLMF